MRAVWLSTWLIAASVLLSPWPTEADQWQVISGDGKEVSSTCLGSNETPTCLAETAIACSVWSEGMMDSRDGRNHRAPICGSSGLLTLHSVLFMPVPKKLARYFYRLETWRLEDADIPNLPRRADRPPIWRAGDTVVEVHAISCRPDRRCLERTGTPRDAGYGANCPIVICFGPPRKPDTFYGVKYYSPDAALIMRRDDKGWNLLAAYRPGSAGSNIDNHWKPDRWRRSQY